MNFKLPFILIFLALITLPDFSFAQKEKLILRHQAHPKRTKNLKLKRISYLMTSDSIAYYDLSSFTDSSFIVKYQVKLRDTVYANGSVHAIMKTKMKEILFTDVIYIRRHLYDGSPWGQTAAWMVLGAGLGVVLLPVAAIDEGRKGVRDWLLFEATLVGIIGTTLGVALVGTIPINYDLKSKWKLVVKHKKSKRSKLERT